MKTNTLSKKIIGKTIKKYVRYADKKGEAIRFEFTDGASLVLRTISINYQGKLSGFVAAFDDNEV